MRLDVTMHDFAASMAVSRHVEDPCFDCTGVAFEVGRMDF